MYEEDLEKGKSRIMLIVQARMMSMWPCKIRVWGQELLRAWLQDWQEHE